MRRTAADGTWSETYTSFMVNFVTIGANPAHDFFSLTNSSMAISMQLRIDSTGNLTVYAGTTPTLKQTIVISAATNTWHRITIHLKSGTAVTGVLEVSVDEGTPVDCSGTIMASWYYLVLGQITVAPGGSIQSDQCYDCIQVNDTTGVINNSWPTNPKILTATKPNADDASYTQWTRSSGSNDYDMIKEVSPDLDTTYVSSNASGDVSSYEFTTTTTEPSNVVIIGVCLTAVAKRVDTAFLTPVLVRGATYLEVTAMKKAVGADYMNPIEWFMETDPITGVAWLMTDLNTTEFGFKHTTS